MPRSSRLLYKFKMCSKRAERALHHNMRLAYASCIHVHDQGGGELHLNSLTDKIKNKY